MKLGWYYFIMIIGIGNLFGFVLMLLFPNHFNLIGIFGIELPSFIMGLVGYQFGGLVEDLTSI